MLLSRLPPTSTDALVRELETRLSSSMHVTSLVPTHPASLIPVVCPELVLSLCQDLCKVLRGELERREIIPKGQTRSWVEEPMTEGSQ